MDNSGNLYISDSGNNRIRMIRDGAIHTIAGTGEMGFDGDGGAAKAAVFNSPQKIAFGPDGRLYIADRGNGRVRVVDRDGVIRTVAGEGRPKGITVSFVSQP
jgi:YVTN family beta-propeller protein